MDSDKQLRIIVFKGEFSWVAQCLEHDICVQADDLDTLRDRMEAAITAELDLCKEIHGHADLSPVPAAPSKFFEMWERRSAFDASGGADGVAYDMAMCA